MSKTKPKIGQKQPQKIKKAKAVFIKRNSRAKLLYLSSLSLLFFIQEALSRKNMRIVKPLKDKRKILTSNTTAPVSCSNIPAEKQVINIGRLLPSYELDIDDFIGILLLNHFYLADVSYAHCLKIRLSDTYNGSFSITRSHGFIPDEPNKKFVAHILVNTTTLYNYIYTKVHGHPPSESKEFLKSPKTLKGYLPHKERLFFDLEVKLSLNQSFSEIPDSEMDHPEDSQIQIISQHLKGEVLDLTYDFRRASNITKINFMINSIPMLPYTNKNIFMASMTFTPKRVQMNRTDQNNTKNTTNSITSQTWDYPNSSQPSKEFLRTLPFTFNMIKRENINLTWFDQLKEIPSYWKIHMGKYLVFTTTDSIGGPSGSNNNRKITLDNLPVMSSVRIYRFDSQYNLKLLKGFKLPNTCDKGFNSQTYKTDSILFSCNGKLISRTYLFTITDNLIVVDYEDLDSKYQKCTYVHTTGEGLSGLVYFSCMDMNKQSGAIFAVYDGPLQFKLAKEIPNTLIVNQLQMLTQGTKMNWDKSRKYTAVVVHVHAHSYTVVFLARIYDMTEPLKPRYNSTWVVPFSIASMDDIPDRYQENPALQFARKINLQKEVNNYLRACAMNGVLIVIDSTPKRSKVTGLRGNFTVINFKTDFVIGYDIQDVYCEAENNLVHLLVKGNGQHYGDLARKAFILKLATWRKASSRFFGSYLRPNSSRSILISQVNPMQVGIIQMVEDPKSEQPQDLGPSDSGLVDPSTTHQKNYNFVGTVAPVDLPQFWLNLTNTPTGNYSLTFQVLSVCGGKTEITIPFGVFKPKKPTITIRNTSINSKIQSGDIRVDNGRPVKKFMKNEINLSEKLDIQGAVTDVEFDKDQNFRDDLYLRMELLRQVNFKSYLVQEEQHQAKASRNQVVDNANYMFFLDGTLVKYNILNGTRFQPNLGVELFSMAMSDQTFNYISLAYLPKKSFFNGVKVIHHFFLEAKILQRTAMFEEIKPTLAVSIFSTTEDPAYKTHFSKPGKPSTWNIPEILLRKVHIPLEITYDSCDFNNLVKSDILINVVAVSNNDYVMVIPSYDKTILTVFKFCLYLPSSKSSSSDPRNHGNNSRSVLGDRKWAMKNLISIDQFSLGMSGFKFNDYMALGISGQLELHLLQDSKLVSLQINPDFYNPVITQVAQTNELDINSKMTLIDCFGEIDANIDHYQVSSPSQTWCIIASDSAYMHEIIIRRKLEKVWTSGAKQQATPKIAKIANITRNGAKKYIFPSTKSPAWIYTGYNYFLARAKDSRFMLIYKANATKYTIGSIWRSYQSTSCMTFAMAAGTEYIIMKTKGFSGKIFEIFDNFRLRVFNDITSLENVTITFNGRATTHIGTDIADSFGPVNLSYSLLEYKQARGIKCPGWTDQGHGLIGSVTHNFFTLWAFCVVFGMILILLTILCVKETGRMSRLKKDFKRLRSVKRKMKRREQYELELQDRKFA